MTDSERRLRGRSAGSGPDVSPDGATPARSDQGQDREVPARSNAGQDREVPVLSDMTVDEIRGLIAGAPPEPGDSLWRALLDDDRKGVRALCERILKRRTAERFRREREERMRRHEVELWEGGAELVAGVDEAGRGPLAGPVVAAAVVLPRELSIEGIDDSKKLSGAKREEFFDLISGEAVAVGVGSVSEKVIDEINILNATHRAMREALDALEVRPSHVLVDGNAVPSLEIPQTALNQGDRRSTAIAAASIVAKVTRDRLLIEMDARYPGYGFAKHKGYGTPEHISALMRLGPCEIHRRSFRVVLDAAGGMSELYTCFRAALMSAEDPERLDRVAREIAVEKERLVPYELAKLRSLYKRCYVRLAAGMPAAK